MFRGTSIRAVLKAIATSRKTVPGLGPELRVTQYPTFSSLRILTIRVCSNPCHLCQAHLQVTMLNTAVGPFMASVWISGWHVTMYWEILPAEDCLKHLFQDPI
jgi:hypothetical protein